MQNRAAEAEKQTEKAYKQIDKLKKKQEEEITTLNHLLAESRIPKDANYSLFMTTLTWRNMMQGRPPIVRVTINGEMNLNHFVMQKRNFRNYQNLCRGFLGTIDATHRGQDVMVN